MHITKIPAQTQKYVKKSETYFYFFKVWFYYKMENDKNSLFVQTLLKV